MKLDKVRAGRRGIAATEMALVAPVIIMLLVGVWEVGRLIMVQNVLNDTAREAARLAGSAGYFSSSNRSNPLGGTLTLIAPSTNTHYEVQKKVLIYLQAANVTTTGATVTVSNLGSAASPKAWSYTWNQSGTGSGSGYDPAAAADQLDNLQVTVTLPYANVGWSPLNIFVSSTTTMKATVKWASMRDIPLSISTTIPTRPLTSSDPLP
jgi:Flp pilus assembly protein TadG